MVRQPRQTAHAISMDSTIPRTSSARKRPSLQQDKNTELPEVGERYRVLDEIGKGGEARIVIGIDTRVWRQVALKILRPELSESPETIQRFLREGTLTAKLQYPGIVAIYDMGKLNGEIFFAMEKVDGVRLRDVLNERASNPEKWPEERICQLFAQVCEIVGYAHSQGVAHRDLKPENIMVVGDRSVYLMDWGIAKDFSEKQDEALVALKARVPSEMDANLTLPGQAKGTPNYMSPEQAMGLVNKIGYRSDVFSLGIILYEILAGKNPFRGESMRDTFAAIKALKPPPPRTNSKELASICEKALQKTPEERYANAAKLGEDVQSAITFHSVTAKKDNLFEQLAKFARRQRGLAAMFFVVCVLAVALIVSRLRDNHDVAALLQAANEHVIAADTATVRFAALEADLTRVRESEIERKQAAADTVRNERLYHYELARVLLERAYARRRANLPDDAIATFTRICVEQIEAASDGGRYLYAWRRLSDLQRSGLGANVAELKATMLALPQPVLTSFFEAGHAALLRRDPHEAASVLKDMLALRADLGSAWQAQQDVQLSAFALKLLNAAESAYPPLEDEDWNLVYTVWLDRIEELTAQGAGDAADVLLNRLVDVASRHPPPGKTPLKRLTKLQTLAENTP
ncbi:MAG: serine/threonine protein kinase [Rhodothermales bacterium]|jgi:serine/threonine protein kinase